MSRPKLDRRANGLKLVWELERIQIALNNLDTHHGKNVSAFLVATYLDDKGATGHLLQAEFNLSALRTRQEFARELSKRFKIFCPTQAETTNWDEIMEQVCVLGQQEALKGSPVDHVTISADSPVPPPKYLLYPFLMEGQANCLFGDGGVGKSQLAAIIYLFLSLGLSDNPLGLQCSQATGLVLDWESSREDWEYTLHRLVKGMGLPPVFLHYRHCFLPLADDVAPIQTAIDEVNAKFIIVDSAGVACGGANMNEPGVANAFFGGLRRFSLSSLIITHNSKGPGFASEKSPMGSVYFTNVPRNVWQVKREQEAGEDFINLSCSDYKRNMSGKRLPLGVRLNFNDINHSVTPECIALDQTGFAADLPLRLRIKNKLSGGPMTAKKLADDLSEKEGSVGTTLSRMKVAGSVTTLEGSKWGLCA